MSAAMGPCGECGETKRLTTKGLVYKHKAIFAVDDCDGYGKPPRTVTETLIKSGYTKEDLHEMFQNITPKRKKLRDRISGFIDNVRNYFNGAWDVYDEE